LRTGSGGVQVEVWVVVPTIDTADAFPVLGDLVPGDTGVAVSTAAGRVNLTAHLKGTV
jgi:hypothetical protein